MSLGLNILSCHFFKRSCKHLPYFQSYLHLSRIFSVWPWIGSTKTKHSCSQAILDSRILVLILVDVFLEDKKSGLLRYNWIQMFTRFSLYLKLVELAECQGYTEPMTLCCTWISVHSCCARNTLRSDLLFPSKHGFLFAVHFLSLLKAGPGRISDPFSLPPTSILFIPLCRQVFHTTLLSACAILFLVLTSPVTSWKLLNSSSPFTSSQREHLKAWWLLESPSQKLPVTTKCLQNKEQIVSRGDWVLPNSCPCSVSP